MLLGLAVVGFALGVAVHPRDDVVTEHDAVVALGGGRERAATAIDLADQLSLPLVLSSSSAHHGEGLGKRCGVDALCVGPRPSSTLGEAQSMLRVAQYFGWQRLLVVTTDVHTSRSRLLFRQCFGDNVSVIGADRSVSGLRRALDLGREAIAYSLNATALRAC